MAKHWDDWRDVIIGYYITDNLTLRDVMQIMRDRHGFNASQRSYRQKFKDWGIRKYRQHNGEAWSSPSGSPQSATRFDPPPYEQIASNPSAQPAPEQVFTNYNVSQTANQNGGWSKNELTPRSQTYQQGHPAWSPAPAFNQYPVPQHTYTQPAQHQQHTYHDYQLPIRPSQPYAASHSQQQHQSHHYY